jgi:hypothetical protein
MPEHKLVLEPVRCQEKDIGLETQYNSGRPHSSLAYRTPDEFPRQWQATSLSETKSMAADQPYQGDPDGLRFAPALKFAPDPYA